MLYCDTWHSYRNLHAAIVANSICRLHRKERLFEEREERGEEVREVGSVQHEPSIQEKENALVRHFLISRKMFSSGVREAKPN